MNQPRQSFFWLLVIVIFTFNTTAVARPGTHPMAVSNFDTTRSQVVFSYHYGLMLEGGHMNTAGYNANFTSTTGRLSAQFGLNYINLNDDSISNPMHGLAASAAAVYGIPIGSRYDNGLPKAAFTFFASAVPTAVFNGEYNFITIPIPIGLGIEVNPAKAISITPFVEMAPSFNLDTIIQPDQFESYLENLDPNDFTVTTGPNGEILDVTMDQAKSNQLVGDIVSQTVKWSVSAAFRIRGGLTMVANLGDSVDLRFNFAAAQTGEQFNAKPTLFFGGGLAFAWDDPPAAILPEKKRLQGVSCDGMLDRFKHCGAYQNLVEDIRQEELQRLADQKAAIKAGQKQKTAVPTLQTAGPRPSARPSSPPSTATSKTRAEPVPAKPDSPPPVHSQAPPATTSTPPVPAAPSASDQRPTPAKLPSLDTPL